MQVFARIRLTVVCVIAVTASPALAQQTKGKEPLPITVSSSAGNLRVERLATLEFPWGMAWLPDGRLLITEKPGRLRIWQNGRLSAPVTGVPKVVYRGPEDQGGLLDIAVDPSFAKNGYVYFSFVEAAKQQPTQALETGDNRLGLLDPKDNVIAGGAVARARLVGNELRDVRVIWRQVPKTMGRGHFGNRLAFGPDGTLYIASGDRMRFEPAQDLSMNLGKIVRINTDGSIPKGNPLAGKKGVRPEIWSYGHRNVLSIAFDPNGQLWAVEMGPLGGDELNRVLRGKNYGWPIVSNGSHYGSPEAPLAVVEIPDHTTTKKFEPPVRSWTPVSSPSGAMFYSGTLFPGWENSMLVGGLSSMALIRLDLDEDKVAVEERIDMKRRIRDMEQARDGSLLVIVDDAKGELLRLSPAEGRGGVARKNPGARRTTPSNARR